MAIAAIAMGLGRIAGVAARGAATAGRVVGRGASSAAKTTRRAVASGRQNILKKAILKRKKIKRKAFIKERIEKKKNIENKQRMNKEKLLKSRPSGGMVVGAASIPGMGFLQRILKFIGVLLIGWLVKNIPKIITFIQDLIKRVKSIVKTLKDFFGNLVNWFKGIGKVISAAVQNFLSLDFNDTSGKIDSAMKELGESFEGMKKNIEDGKKHLTKPIGHGEGESKSQSQSSGSNNQNNGSRTQSGGTGTTGGGSATGKFGALLDFIAKGEGGYNSMNQGTRGGRIVGSTHDASTILGKNLTDMTIGEVMGHQNSGMLFAAGRYQIIPETMKFAISSSGLSMNDKFNPRNQDRLGVSLIQHKRPYAYNYLTGKHNDLDGAMLAMAQEWASLPDPRTGNSYYGSGNRALHSVAEVRNVMMRVRGEKNVPISSIITTPTLNTSSSSQTSSSSSTSSSSGGFSGTAPSATVASVSSPSQQPRTLESERRGQDVIIMEEESPPMNMSSSGGGKTLPIIVSDMSLNRFMKTQLLLDLAYT